MIISSFYKSNCDSFPTFADRDKTLCSGRVEIAEFSSIFVELKLGNSEGRVDRGGGGMGVKGEVGGDRGGGGRG